MREILKYKNHMNEVIEFGTSDFYVNESELHNFTWEVISKNNRISAFNRGVVTKTIPVVIATTDEGMTLRNRLFEICEKDVLANKHGMLIIGDYYMKCFVTQSIKRNYLKSSSAMNVELQVTTDMPYWVKETTEAFGFEAGTVGQNMDFNRDFPVDYTSNMIGKKLINTNFVPSNFRIIVYGECEEPSITIGGHVYAVNVTIGASEYLTIDSTEKTIILTHMDGSTTNCFNLRNKESYIFEKIQTGELFVSKEGNFKFDVVLLEERGEPKWI